MLFGCLELGWVIFVVHIRVGTCYIRLQQSDKDNDQTNIALPMCPQAKTRDESSQRGNNVRTL
ncbi:hypothetical protein DPMN_106159 [Dreissena polymorpha]|uniref:Secreted protein n=1 Tax=Dreissena polymorpha TaxID=45954 RepID=A0A9D4K4H1_DREPO|nr:hypothetical protein DPMN_106159 [Dreissena polymorpha]